MVDERRQGRGSLISRRKALIGLGSIGALGLGALTATREEVPEENTGTPEGGSAPDGVFKDTDNSNSTDDSSESGEGSDVPRFQDSGVLYVEAADGLIGPEGFFDQGEQLEGEPDTHIELKDENGEPITEQELVEKYHFNQLQQTAQHDGVIEEGQRETLKELPYNILEGEWVMENLVTEMPEFYTGENPKNPFQKEEYLTDEDFKTRYTESRLPDLWNIIAHVTLGGPSSTNDYIKADGIAAIEYHAADKETATFSMKTNDAIHGLTFGITNPGYDDLDKQETWIIETDPNEKKQVTDLDEKESYPTRSQEIFVEVEDTEDQATRAWKDLGLTPFGLDYITSEFHDGQQFEEFLVDPGEQAGRKFLHSAVITAYINEQARPDGALPEFENAQLDVYPDRIEYELAD